MVDSRYVTGGIQMFTSLSNLIRCGAVLACLTASATAGAMPITISIDTSAIAGTTGSLAFDFTDGNPVANSVTITGFTTDGTLGVSTATGGVTGSLPSTVLLEDTSFFNELLTQIVLGTSIMFSFTATTNAGVTADQFSVFLLNPAGSASLFPTSDPLGADALLAFDITDGNGVLSLFVAPDGEAVVTASGAATPVPEPASLLLLGAGLAAAGVTRYRREC